MNQRPSDSELVETIEDLVGGRSRVASFVVLDDKPGMRCVASATVTPMIVAPAGGPPIGTVFAKWFRDAERGLRNHVTLTALAEVLRDDRRVRVPTPLGFAAGRGVLVMGAMPGRSWSSLGFGTDQEARRRAPALGEAIAALHLSGAPVPAEYVIGDELRTVHQWADQLALASPPADLLARYRDLAARVESATAALAWRTDAVIHRDLHEEHLFVEAAPDRDLIGMIDLDEARRGDPVVDLAHLAMHIHLAAGTSGADLRSGPYGAVEHAWQQATGWTPPADGFAVQVALTSLKLARQRALGYGTRPRAVGTARWPLIDRVLALGEHWITRSG